MALETRDLTKVTDPRTIGTTRAGRFLDKLASTIVGGELVSFRLSDAEMRDLVAIDTGNLTLDSIRQELDEIITRNRSGRAADAGELSTAASALPSPENEIVIKEKTRLVQSASEVIDQSSYRIGRFDAGDYNGLAYDYLR